MIKQLLSITLIFAGFMASAQSFTATYDFAATTTVSGTTDPTVPPVVTGVTCGSFVAVGTPSANPNASGRFSFIGWPTGATNGNDTYAALTGSINTAEYYEVTLTPQSGYVASLNSITFTAQRSGTGVRSFAVRVSADGFMNNLPAAVTSNTNLAVMGANEFFWTTDAVTSAQNGSSLNLFGASSASPVTFRFYGWNSEAGTGTFSIDNVVFNGSVTLTTGIGKLSFDLNSNFNVYPVPSHDGVVYIESKNGTELSKIEVLDVLGNVVLTNSAPESKVKINLADLSNGNYFVRMYSGNSVSTKKISVIK